MTIDMDQASIHDEFISRQLKFTELKKKFIDISGPHVTKDILETLKENYSSVINSKREKDRVKNVEGLLRILEKRDVLRYDDIGPLKEIAGEYIKDQILSRCLIDYEAGVKNLPALTPINHYRYRAMKGTSSGASKGGIELEHTVNFYENGGGALVPYGGSGGSTRSPTDGVQEKVFQRVSENLGKSWRDVARFLGVKESEIDAIEGKTFLGTKEKAYEALLIFKSRSDSFNWRIKLHKALEKARRKDLAELVNEIAFPNDS